MWASHDVRLHHEGRKTFIHPDVGPIELTYHSLPLDVGQGAVLDLTIYTAEPSTPADDTLKLLASLGATAPGRATEQNS